MKYLIICLLSVVTFWSCDENVYNTYESDPRFFNDAFHGNITGKVIQKNSNATVIISQVDEVASAEISSSDGSFSIVDLEIGNYDLIRMLWSTAEEQLISVKSIYRQYLIL